MTVILRLGLALALWLAAVLAAAAEPRIALVVGNGAYAHVTPLDNPGQDARLVAAELVSLGFTVTQLRDADQATLSAAVAKFGRDLRDAGPDATGLFYYAGHGVQSFGANYLLPVDALLTDAADLGLVALDAAAVLRQMSSARNRTNIVILDACRNNPFESVPDLNDNGLAEMKAPPGTFLAYATEPGSVALDGLGGNSPFTAALVAEMSRPGLPVEQLFKEVRIRVRAETQGLQTPWDASSLTSDFAFVPGMPEPAGLPEAEAMWETVSASGDPVQVMLFLRSFPDSAQAEEARALLADLMAKELEQGAGQELAAVAPDPAPAVPPEPPPPTALPEDFGPFAFDTALAVGDPILDGRTLPDLIAGTPAYPPFEGLPEEMWKGQTCTGCHQWTREALCIQSKTYQTAQAERSLTASAEAHPYGATFRKVLRRWGMDDCP